MVMMYSPGQRSFGLALSFHSGEEGILHTKTFSTDRPTAGVSRPLTAHNKFFSFPNVVDYPPDSIARAA